MTLYNADPPTKLMCPESSILVKFPETESSGGYAISVVSQRTSKLFRSFAKGSVRISN